MPLAILTSIKYKFEWKQVEQELFEKIKQIMVSDTLSTYPDFNNTFNIHTNASTLKLGAVISQKRKPIASYIRKLTDAQQ